MMASGYAGVLFRAILKSALTIVVVGGVCFGLGLVDPRLGSTAMLICSFLLFIKSYRKEWPVRWYTCWLPVLSSLVCFAVQTRYFPRSSGGIGLLAGLVLGIGLGWLRARGHQLLIRGSLVVSKRTTLVLFVWMTSYLLTHSFGILELEEWIRLGVSVSVLSTAAVCSFSVLLYLKYRRLVVAPAGTAGGAGGVSAGAAAVVLLISATISGQTSGSGLEPGSLVFRMELSPEVRTYARQSVEKLAALFPQKATIHDLDLSMNPVRAVYNPRLESLEIDNATVHVSISGSTPTEGTMSIRANIDLVFMRGHTGADGSIGGSHRFDMTWEAKGMSRKQSQNARWRLVWTDPLRRGLIYAEGGENAAPMPAVFAITLEGEVGSGVPPPRNDRRDDSGSERSEPGSPFGPPGRDPRDPGSGLFPGGTPPSFDDYLAQSGDDPLPPDWDRQLEDFFSRYRPSLGSTAEAAAGAGLIAGLYMLLAGAGLNAALALAHAVATGVPVGSVPHAPAQTPPPHAPAQAPPELVDPRDGRRLHVDGDRVYWDDDTGWVDRATADRWIREIHQERRDRNADMERRWAVVQDGRDHYYAQRDRDLQSQGNRWDADRQAWVSPNAPGTAPVDPMTDDERLDEFYRRGDWLSDHMVKLTDGQRRHVQAGLDRIGWQDHGVAPGEVSPDDLSALRDLNRRIYGITGSSSDRDAALALVNAADAGDNAQLAQAVANLGRYTGGYVEATFLPTGGALTGFLYGLTDDSGNGRIANAALSSAATLLDQKLSRMDPTNVLWNTTTGSLIGAGEMWLRGGSKEDIQRGALMGGVFNAAQALGSRPSVQELGNDIGGRVRNMLGLGGAPDVDLPVIRGDAEFSRPQGTGADADLPVIRGDAELSRPSRGPAEFDDPSKLGSRASGIEGGDGGLMGPRAGTEPGNAVISRSSSGSEPPPVSVGQRRGGTEAPGGDGEVIPSRPRGDDLDPRASQGDGESRTTAEPEPSRPQSGGDEIRERVQAAIDSDDPKRQLEVFRDRGADRLGVAEERGLLSPQEARTLTSRATAAVNEAVTKSATTAMTSFQETTGVKITELVVGDSGSSAAQGARSILSDNDRTLIPQFEYTSLQIYANRNHGGNVEAAYQDLKSQYRDLHAATADRYLQLHHGVKAEDLGCQLYAGMGSKSSGPDDIYGPGFTRVRQSVAGRGTVIQPDGRAYTIDGDGVVQAEHLESTGWDRFSRRAAGGAEPDIDPYADVRRMSAGDEVESIRQQTIKAGHIDPADATRPQVVNAAKAMDRTAKAGRRLGSTDGLDPEIVEVSKAIRENPQAAGQILKSHGLTREDYLRRVRDGVTAFGRKHVG